MSTQEIFAAFVVNRPDGAGNGSDQAPLEWVGERAGRAGLAPRVATPDPAAPDADDLPYGGALPYMEGDWLGMPVELRFIEGDDYHALVLVVGHAAFLRRVVRSSGAFLEEVVSAFRDACDAIEPTYAYLVTTPEDDIPGRLKQVSVDLHGLNPHGLDPQALSGLGLPLTYLDGTRTTQALSGDRAVPASPMQSVLVPAQRGVVLVVGDSLTGWL